MTLPADILAFAQSMRQAFGPKVKLKHACDERTGQHWGNRAYDYRDGDPADIERDKAMEAARDFGQL